MWNLGTAVNHLEMGEIKSVKLRDNLKIHKRQTGHMVTSIQMMRNLFFAVANIISEHQSICKKFCNRDDQFYSIYFRNLQLNTQVTKTSSHELYEYFSDRKTNKFMTKTRPPLLAIWRQHQRQALSFNHRKTSWNSFIVTHNNDLLI